jgi:hypothetical protein
MNSDPVDISYWQDIYNETHLSKISLDPQRLLHRILATSRNQSQPFPLLTRYNPSSHCQYFRHITTDQFTQGYRGRHVGYQTPF